MEKKIITNATFQSLFDSNLVFDKDTFKSTLNYLLLEHDLELHEKTVQELLKTLETKGYLIQEENLFIKTNKTLAKPSNKQHILFSDLLDEYQKEFDLSYIKNQYEKIIKSQEQTSSEHLELIENSFNFFVNEYNLYKKTSYDKDLLL